jgi:hypothetical protein
MKLDPIPLLNVITKKTTFKNRRPFEKKLVNASIIYVIVISNAWMLTRYNRPQKAYSDKYE